MTDPSQEGSEEDDLDTGETDEDKELLDRFRETIIPKQQPFDLPKEGQ